MSQLHSGQELLETLQEALRFADGIIETLRQPLLVLDGTLRVVRANRAFYKSFALSPEETMGRYLYELDERQWDIPELRQLLENILPLNTSLEDFQVEHDFASRGRRVMLLNARRIYDEQGKTQFILLAIEDITERQQFMDELARSEQRFRAVIENTLQGIVIVQDFRIVFANQAFADICGYTIEELLSLPPKKVMKLVHPEDRALVWGRFRSRLAGKEVPERYEYRGVRKNGEVVWLEMYARLINYDDRPAVEGAVIDVSERRQAQEQMRWQAAALETASNAIFMTGRDGHIQWVNPAFTKLTGYSAEEVVGQTPRILKSGHHDQAFYEHLWRTILAGEVWRGETIDRRKDGSLFYAGMVITPLRDDQGQITRFVSILEDLTEYRQERERVQKALQERETLLRELYHRTRNNMQVILAWLSLEAARVGRKEVYQSFYEMEKRIQTMALVHQKLYEANDLSYIDLQEYVREVVELLYRSYKKSKGAITLHVDVAPEKVLIDTAIPCGLLLNELMSNALKHAFPDDRDGEIYIKIFRPNSSEIEIDFYDNGVGLSPAVNLRHIRTLGVQTIMEIVEHQMQGVATYSGENGMSWRIRLRDDLYQKRV